MGNEVKWAGWDIIMLKGKSPSRSTCHHNDKVEFEGRQPVWGKTRMRPRSL